MDGIIRAGDLAEAAANTNDQLGSALQIRLAKGQSLDSARELLEAAGIICHIEHMAGKLSPAVDAVLAWTVREGVTNVIRHSRAKRCIIRVSLGSGSASAEIVNDAGVMERVYALGGQVEAAPYQTPEAAGFRLRVELPIPDQMASGKE